VTAVTVATHTSGTTGAGVVGCPIAVGGDAVGRAGVFGRADGLVLADGLALVVGVADERGLAEVIAGAGDDPAGDDAAGDDTAGDDAAADTRGAVSMEPGAPLAGDGDPTAPAPR